MGSFVTGQIIEARCSRCRDITGHVVVACLKGIPVKVECRACGSVHRYAAPDAIARRAQEATVSVRAGRDRTQAVDAAAHAQAVRGERAERPCRQSRAERSREEAESRWRDAVAGIVSQPVPYAMTGCFPADFLVDHPVFGVGAVLEVFPPDKMDVLFRGGVKRLRCAC